MLEGQYTMSATVYMAEIHAALVSAEIQRRLVYFEDLYRDIIMPIPVAVWGEVMDESFSSDDDDDDHDANASAVDVDAIIASLPTEVVPPEGEPADGDPCSVCYLPYTPGEQRTRLTCAHTYHTECIQSWMRQSRGRCALCNRTME